MDEAIISWNVPNAVTVFLMAIIGALFFAGGVAALRKMSGGSDA